MDYVARLIEPLSIVPQKWRQDAAEEIGNNKEIQNFELRDKIINYIVFKIQKEKEAK